MTPIKRLFCAALLTLGAMSTAHAVLIRYDFSAAWTLGPLAGTQSFGSLAFDSSLAVANAMYTQPDLLQSFSAVVGGTSYGLADVGLGFLSFDADAQLRLLGVGTDCGPGYCSASQTDAKSLYLVYDSQSQLDRFFAVAGAVQSDAGTFALAPVPEPGTWVLLGAGLLALVAFRRARPPSISAMPA